MAFRGFGSVLLLFLGCHQIASWAPIPPPPKEARSAILALKSEQGVLVSAMNLAAGLPTALFSNGEGSQVVVLYYDLTLEELALIPGPLVAAQEGDPKRSIPTSFLAAHASTEKSGWQEAATLPDFLNGFRMAGIEPFECAEKGGCFHSTEALEDVDCQVPCRVAMPQPPNTNIDLPVLPQSDCPQAWNRRTIDAGGRSAEICVPPEREGCSGALVQYLDRTTCAPIDGCPTDRFRADLPAGTVYVASEAPAGGDGSYDQPFNSLTDALATTSTVIALSRGTFRDAYEIDRPVRIVGACPEQTIVRPPARRATLFVVNVQNTSIEQLSIQGGTFAVYVENNASLQLKSVLITEQDNVAVSVAGDLEAERLVVRSATTGIEIVGGTSHLHHVLLQDCDRALVLRNSVVEGRDVAIERGSSHGVTVLEASLDIQRALVSDRGLKGFDVESGTLIAQNLVVERTGLEATGFTYGHSIKADHSSITVRDALLQTSRGCGLSSRTDSGLVPATVDLDDVIVSDVIPVESQSKPIFGEGISLVETEATLDRIVVRRAYSRGIQKHSAVPFHAYDITIDEVLDLENHPEDEALTSGLFIGDGGQALRVAVTDVSGNGVRISDGDATISHVTITGDRPSIDPPDPEAPIDCGLQVNGRTVLNASLVQIENLERSGICLFDTTQGSFSDLTVMQVGNRALMTENLSVFTVARATFTDAYDGVAAFEDSRQSLEDVVVQGMTRIPPNPSDLGGRPLGRGLYAHLRGAIELKRFRVSNCRDAGLDVYGPEAIIMRDGVITENAVGARLDFDTWQKLFHLVSICHNTLDFQGGQR